MAMPDITLNEDLSVQPHPDPLASTLNSQEYAICEVDGAIDAQTAEILPVTSGADTHDVKRLLLAEVRVAVFHISPYAWSGAYAEACQKWLSFVACCVEHQCDFISGDGNLFAQRSFKQDEHSDFRTSIMVDILERFLQQVNLQRSPINRTTYNVVSSTMASEYLRSMEGKKADCDSMILISLRYGKQVAVSEARGKEFGFNKDSASADGPVGSAFSDEVMLNDVEQLKHLLTYDLGLAEKDCAYHSPLLAFAQLKALKNMRIRSKESEDRRRARWGGLNESYKDKRDDRKTQRRERQGSVPPLRRDSYRNVGEQRSRSASRISSRDISTRRPPPPPAPVRPPVTPQKTPPKTPPSQQPRFKAAPPFTQQAPTTSTATPPVKAPPVPPPRSARSPSNDPLVASRTVGTPGKTPPWREREQRQSTARGRERSQAPVERNTRTRTESRSSWTDRSLPTGVPEPPPPPSRMSGSQWLN